VVKRSVDNRSRGRVGVILAGVLTVSLGALASGQSPVKAADTPRPSTTAPVPPKPAVAAKPAGKAAVEPLDRQPYRIRALIATEPEARFDARCRAELLEGWLMMVRRFVGAPWQVEVLGEEQATPHVFSAGLEALDPESIEPLSEGVEKVWLIRVGAAGSGLVFTGREYDAATRRLGALQRREAPVVRDAPRVMLMFSLDLFAPYARIGEHFGKDVALTVRGASLEPASPLGQIAAPGTVFQPFRAVPRMGSPPLVREIPYTFLRADSNEGPTVHCSFTSGLPDPFTNRVVQKTDLVALGVKPGKMPTRLRFQTLPDKAPAAGYVLTARAFPDGSPREVGMTDREGRIAIPPGFSDGLVVIRLLAGSEEPMIEFPLMPGDSPSELVVPPFDPKPLTIMLETRLDSIRDTVIDLVAVRARLEARLKARFDGEDWPGAEDTLKEFNALTPKETFATEVARLKDEAAKEQASSKRAILTKTAQARIADLQSLIERYLDDEGFKAYADALEKLKADPKGKAKAKAQAKAQAKTQPQSAAKPGPAGGTPQPVQPAPPTAPTPTPAPAPAPPPQPPAPTPPKATVPF
jgi:hypothetical protein